MRWERHNDKSEDLKKKKNHMYFKMIALCDHGLNSNILYEMQKKMSMKT